LGDTGTDWRIILKWIFRKWGVEAQIGKMGLRIG